VPNSATQHYSLLEPALFDTDTDCTGVALVRRALLLLSGKFIEDFYLARGVIRPCRNKRVWRLRNNA
jgi:hypothetical protein